MRIPQRNIWRLFRLFLATKARTKTFNCNSHKENCKDFLIFDWDLGKVEEHCPFSAQTCDYFITTSWIHEACHLLNLFKIPLQIHYRNMKVNNLSKSPSLTLFFIWKLCSKFLLKVVTLIFLLVCFVSLKERTSETRKNIFTSFRKCSWDNQILTFQIFKFHDVIKCSSLKQETNFTE